MTKDLERACNMLKGGGYTCVLRRDEVTHTSFARGVRPLLELIDGEGVWKDFSAADKVVGKATAFLYVLLGVRAVHALVISAPAAQVLEQFGVEVSWDVQVEAISNRTNTGPCPMESAVRDISQPMQALDAIRTALARLMANG